MEIVVVNGREYIKIQSLATALNVCTGTVYNWRKAGTIEFCWPLGKSLTFVTRETADRLMRLRITEQMGAFIMEMKS